MPLSASSSFVSRFERMFTLTEDARSALERLPVHVRQAEPRQDVVREGDRPSRSCLVIEGLACTSKVTTKGRREIMAFHIAGNMPDLHSLHLGVLDSDIRTVTACTLGFVDHSALRALCRDHPRLGASLWRTTLVDGAVFREWLTNVGQREAFGRLAHLFCEMRMENAHLAADKHCSFQVTQIELAEASGMSSVHVNRTLQELRGENLVSFQAGWLTIHNWDRLAEAGEFDPTYLHLDEPQMAA